MVKMEGKVKCLSFYVTLALERANEEELVVLFLLVQAKIDENIQKFWFLSARDRLLNALLGLFGHKESNGVTMSTPPETALRLLSVRY